MKSIKPLVTDFCKFSYMQDNSDASIPNIQPGLEMFMGNEKIAKYVEGYDFKGWDVLDEVSLVSPELLSYILLVSKAYWESKQKSAKTSKKGSAKKLSRKS